MKLFGKFLYNACKFFKTNDKDGYMVLWLRTWWLHLRESFSAFLAYPQIPGREFLYYTLYYSAPFLALVSFVLGFWSIHLYLQEDISDMQAAWGALLSVSLCLSLPARSILAKRRMGAGLEYEVFPEVRERALDIDRKCREHHGRISGETRFLGLCLLVLGLPYQEHVLGAIAFPYLLFGLYWGAVRARSMGQMLYLRRMAVQSLGTGDIHKVRRALDSWERSLRYSSMPVAGKMMELWERELTLFVCLVPVVLLLGWIEVSIEGCPTTTPVVYGQGQFLQDYYENRHSANSLSIQLSKLLKRYIFLANASPESMLQAVAFITDPNILSHFCANYFLEDPFAKQDILQTLNIDRRLRQMIEHMEEKIQIKAREQHTSGPQTHVF